MWTAVQIEEELIIGWDMIAKCSIFSSLFLFLFFLFLEQYDMNIRRVVEIGMVCQKETILMQILTTVSNDHCGILLLLMLSAAFSEFMLQFLG